MFKPQYVFVYGTLRSGYGNNRILSRSKFVGRGETVGSHFTMIQGGFPYVLNEGLFKIRGELYLVSDQETMDRLDGLEGYPDHYTRKEVEIHTSEDDFTAWIYLAASRTASYIRDREQVLPDDNGVCEWQRKVIGYVS